MYHIENVSIFAPNKLLHFHRFQFSDFSEHQTIFQGFHNGNLNFLPPTNGNFLLMNPKRNPTKNCFNYFQFSFTVSIFLNLFNLKIVISISFFLSFILSFSLSLYFLYLEHVYANDLRT